MSNARRSKRHLTPEEANVFLGPLDRHAQWSLLASVAIVLIVGIGVCLYKPKPVPASSSYEALQHAELHLPRGLCLVRSGDFVPLYEVWWNGKTAARKVGVGWEILDQKGFDSAAYDLLQQPFSVDMDSAFRDLYLQLQKRVYNERSW